MSLLLKVYGYYIGKYADYLSGISAGRSAFFNIFFLSFRPAKIAVRNIKKPFLRTSEETAYEFRRVYLLNCLLI